MNDRTWRDRLLAAVKASGKSQREVSLAAGLNPGYVNSLKNEKKDPTISNLLAVCAEAGVSLSYVLYGVDLTSETEEILALLESGTPGEREGLLKMLRERRRPSSP